MSHLHTKMWKQVPEESALSSLFNLVKYNNQWSETTLQSLYNTVRYKTVMDIKQFKDGSQKCTDYIEK